MTTLYFSSKLDKYVMVPVKPVIVMWGDWSVLRMLRYANGWNRNACSQFLLYYFDNDLWYKHT